MFENQVTQFIQQIIGDSNDTLASEEAYVGLISLGEVAIDGLVATLQDTTHDEHHTIASILSDILVDIGDNDALGLLQHLLSYPTQDIFTPAVRAIAQLKLPHINRVLCDLLKHPAPQVRRVVAWQIGRNRATKSAACLSKHLNEIDMETLRGIIWSLGHVGDMHTIRRLQPFTYHMSDDIAFMAKEAILRIEEKILNLPFK